MNEDLRGDVNFDGKIGADDAQSALTAYTESIIGNETGLSDRQKKAADVNRDGVLGVEDAQFILLYYTENVLAGKSLTWEQILK